MGWFEKITDKIVDALDAAELGSTEGDRWLDGRSDD